MVYINREGAILERQPMTIFGLFWGVINFFYLLFRTLFQPNYNMRNHKNFKDFGPSGRGPPKPPPPKFGMFRPGGDGPSPPPMGGCGCG